MQCVIFPDTETVFAVHEDGQDVSMRYGAVSLPLPDGSGTTERPAAAIVRVPHDFRFAYDDEGRILDPRTHAGEGSTPLGT
jgi:hypothetical protein